jgi:hypothetical protein
MYYYLFYKFYKITVTGAFPSLGKFYAEIFIMTLELFLLLSLFAFYNVFIDRYAKLELISVKTIVTNLVILIGNFRFFSGDEWWDIVAEFDKWPPQKNKKGSFIVALLVLGIAASFILSFYFLFQVDWEKYR